MQTLSPIFTVFTPTFNRAHTLHRVYESLCQQSFRDFEWLIVDDGSVDNTADLVRLWMAEATFPIRYLPQQNAGKHRAMNRAVREANGLLFLPIDSDDGFVPNALQVLYDSWQCIPETRRQLFTGVVCRCQTEGGVPYSAPFPNAPLESNALALRFRLKVRGELWGFHRTEVLKAFPFPEESGLSFIPENIVWDAIARTYQVLCINDCLRIFYQDAGNQVTKRDPAQKAAQRRFFLYFVNRDIDYFWSDPLTFFKWAILYVRYSLHAGEAGILAREKYQSTLAYAVCGLAWVPGFLLYALDTRVAKRQSRRGLA